MAFQETVKEIRALLAALTLDLEKAANGNKAASQRVRTGTIKLEKSAKKYRKESIKAEKSGAFKKQSAARKTVAKTKVAKKPAKPVAVPLKKPAAKALKR